MLLRRREKRLPERLSGLDEFDRRIALERQHAVLKRNRKRLLAPDVTAFRGHHERHGLVGIVVRTDVEVQRRRLESVRCLRAERRRAAPPALAGKNAHLQRHRASEPSLEDRDLTDRIEIGVADRLLQRVPAVIPLGGNALHGLLVRHGPLPERHVGARIRLRLVLEMDVPDAAFGKLQHVEDVLPASGIDEVARVKRKLEVGDLRQETLQVLCVGTGIRRSAEVLDRDGDAGSLRLGDERLHVREDLAKLRLVLLAVREVRRHDHDARDTVLLRLFEALRRLRAVGVAALPVVDVGIEPVGEEVEVDRLQLRRRKLVEIRFVRPAVVAPYAGRVEQVGRRRQRHAALLRRHANEFCENGYVRLRRPAFRPQRQRANQERNAYFDLLH